VPVLPDITTGALQGDDPKRQIESLVSQVNEWGRRISNESKTLVIKGDQSTEAIIIGQQEDGSIGILMNDGDNDRFFLGNEVN